MASKAIKGTTVTKKQTYEGVAEVLQQHNVIADPAEIHGILCGLLSGGMGHAQNDWINVLQDTCNEEGVFNEQTVFTLTQVFNECCQDLIEGQFSLNLLLPNDEATLNARGVALIEWVQGFMLGFGMQQNDLTKCSDEVKEVMEDFSDIARMEEPMEEDEESERALQEVIEYVRMSAMFCFSELGKSLLDDAPSPSVH